MKSDAYWLLPDGTIYIVKIKHIILKLIQCNVIYKITKNKKGCLKSNETRNSKFILGLQKFHFLDSLFFTIQFLHYTPLMLPYISLVQNFLH